MDACRTMLRIAVFDVMYGYPTIGSGVIPEMDAVTMMLPDPCSFMIAAAERIVEIVPNMFTSRTSFQIFSGNLSISPSAYLRL